MRMPFLALAFFLVAGSQSIAAQPAEQIAESPSRLLAEDVRVAIVAGDAQAWHDLIKWDGVDDITRAAIDRMTESVLGRAVESVAIEPLDAANYEPYEFKGVRYVLNGEPKGQVTVNFVPEPPLSQDSFTMAFGVEDGRAVILLARPDGQ